MRKRSVRVSFVIMTVLVMVAVSCTEDSGGGEATGTEGGGENGGGPIWVLLPDTASSDRWEGDDLPLFTEAFEAEGLVNGEDFNIVNAEGDSATQQSQAEQAIADGASVIVLTSLDTGSGATIIDQAKDAGVQVDRVRPVQHRRHRRRRVRQLRQRRGGRSDGDRDGAGDRRARSTSPRS